MPDDQSDVVDVTYCHEFIVHVPLLAREEAGTNDPSTWPMEVREAIAAEYRVLRTRHPQHEIVAREAKLLMPQRICIMTYFHREPEAA